MPGRPIMVQLLKCDMIGRKNNYCQLEKIKKLFIGKYLIHGLAILWKNFEEDNMRQINASRAAAKYQNLKKDGNDDDDSSDDSLDGWEIRP